MGNLFGSSTTEECSSKSTSTAAQVAKPSTPKCTAAVNKLIEKTYKSYERSKIDIEADCRDVKMAVLSAKFNKWTNVFHILGTPEAPKKEYLINGIPETRRWGILHQAVFWRNTDIIQTLLAFPGCDTDLKAKVGDSEIGDAVGKTAIEMANDFKYDEISEVLRRNDRSHDEDLSTFVPFDPSYEGYAHPLLRITLALYRDKFCSSLPLQNDRSFHSILFDIFVDLETSADRWLVVKEIICDSLLPVTQSAAMNVNSATTKTEFYGTIINAYTVEDSWLYAYINRALRRQNVKHYTPPADDLACGPYIVMYYILLMFWTDLIPEVKTTFRRMRMSKAALQEYEPNTKFIWIAFTSSALLENNACSFPSCPADVGCWPPEEYVEVIFVIDNSLNTPWNPRNIAKYARYNESERTYPPGARFIVTKKVKMAKGVMEPNELYTVHLKLLDSV